MQLYSKNRKIPLANQSGHATTKREHVFDEEKLRWFKKGGVWLAKQEVSKTQDPESTI